MIFDWQWILKEFSCLKYFPDFFALLLEIAEQTVWINIIEIAENCMFNFEISKHVNITTFIIMFNVDGGY